MTSRELPPVSSIKFREVVRICGRGGKVMARAKRQVARGIGSAAMYADSRQTDFCTYLSAILLGGLLLNAVLGWWWADPVAGLVMVPIISKEGVDGLRAKACCGSDV